MPILDIGEMEKATAGYVAARKSHENERTQRQHADEEKLRDYRKRLRERALNHAHALLVWSETAEFEEAKKLTEASGRSIQLGNTEGVNASFSYAGFMLHQNGSPAPADPVRGLEDLQHVGLCFIYSWEDPDFRGTYPGGIVCFIQERLQEVISAAPPLL